MKLTVDYLENRHNFWVNNIAKQGIWDAEKFKDIKILIRNRSCSYEGMFIRKSIVKNNKIKINDSIIIYQCYPDLSFGEIDDTLVHEMIHQFITQNNLSDTRIHGRLFQDFMNCINESFPNELKISISGIFKELKGPGSKLHKLIIVCKNNNCFICKIMPSKLEYFTELLKNMKYTCKITDYILCESNDMYFEMQTSCRKNLHGIKLSMDETRTLCRECQIKPI